MTITTSLGFLYILWGSGLRCAAARPPGGSNWVSRTTSMSHIVSKHDCQHFGYMSRIYTLVVLDTFQRIRNLCAAATSRAARARETTTWSATHARQRPPRMAKKATYRIQLGLPKLGSITLIQEKNQNVTFTGLILNFELFCQRSSTSNFPFIRVLKL